VPLSGSYLDHDEFAARCADAQRRLVLGLFIDPTGQFTDPDKIARRDNWLAFVDVTLVEVTDDIHDRLRKRYATPFASPVPTIILRWFRDLVMPRLYEARGWDTTDAQAKSILDREQRANVQIEQAADSKDGLYDLPLNAGTAMSGISLGGPIGYAEASPYTWADLQRDAAASEDSQ
jgi:hypothetical protein